MTCGDLQSLFADYLDGHASSAVRHEFEAHMKSCTDCAHRLRGVRAIRARLARLERKHLPDTFGFTIRRMLLEEVEQEESRWAKVRELLWPTPQVAWSAAIGSIVAAVSFGVFWLAVAPGMETVTLDSRVGHADSVRQTKSVRYVLEHLPLEGDLIETTAKDTASLTTTPAAPTGAQPVSASF